MNILERLLSGDLELGRTEKRRRMFLFIGIVLAVSTIIVLDSLNFFGIHPLELILDMTGVVILMLNFVILRRIRHALWLYRTDVLLMAVLFLYYIFEGGRGGGAVLWSFSYPLIAFFLLGKQEGVVWVSVFFSGAVLLLFGYDLLGTYEYIQEIQIRYVVSYMILFILSYMIESLREKYENESNESIRRLTKALEEVKTLKGLLPICAHCKKVRDDKGYWNRIETYLSDRTDAEFTHGLCPDCMEIYYPSPKEKQEAAESVPESGED